jgi:hypothetical protein
MNIVARPAWVCVVYVFQQVLCVRAPLYKCIIIRSISFIKFIFTYEPVRGVSFSFFSHLHLPRFALSYTRAVVVKPKPNKPPPPPG